MIEAPTEAPKREYSSADPIAKDHSPEEESGSDFMSLLSSLASDASLWLHQETELAKAEFGQKLKLISNNAIKLLVSTIILGAGAIVLLLAFVVGVGLAFQWMGIAAVPAFGLAALLVGGTLFLAGIIIFKRAKTTLLASELLPGRAAERLQETKNWALNKIK